MAAQEVDDPPLRMAVMDQAPVAEQLEVRQLAPAMVCGGWGGASEGTDLAKVQALLDDTAGLRAACEAREGGGGAFSSWRAESYTETQQVVAGTNHKYTVVVAIAEGVAGCVVRELKLRHFVALPGAADGGAPQLEGWSQVGKQGQDDPVVQVVQQLTAVRQ